MGIPWPKARLGAVKVRCIGPSLAFLGGTRIHILKLRHVQPVVALVIFIWGGGGTCNGSIVVPALYYIVLNY